MKLMLLSLSILAGSTLAASLVTRQSSTYDFGGESTYCTCPPVTGGSSIAELNAYLSGARNYFLDCQYVAPGPGACTYDTTGAAVNPPSSCPANSLPASTASSEYCYITCPSTVGGAALDTTQSNVVILASGTSYTTCRYQDGSNCQYDPLTGARGNVAAGGACPSSNAKTAGCCFNLQTVGGSATTSTTPSEPPTSSSCLVMVAAFYAIFGASC